MKLKLTDGYLMMILIIIIQIIIGYKYIDPEFKILNTSLLCNKIENYENAQEDLNIIDDNTIEIFRIKTNFNLQYY